MCFHRGHEDVVHKKTPKEVISLLLKLKHALVDDGRPQYEIARAASVEETRFSKALNGRCDLGEQEKVKVATVLGRKVEELFGGDGQ